MDQNDAQSLLEPVIPKIIQGVDHRPNDGAASLDRLILSPRSQQRRSTARKHRPSFTNKWIPDLVPRPSLSTSPKNKALLNF